ncbi:MOSC domain-containing protein [Pseudolabrys taiwanensis]|uniref:MOSC domain-containing protein n=1 Tax=Pseudolabrys taiwanensis TaxID=331696 RepID=A0A345ZQU0_9HYPH|nr:MOSC domain-containing protein [Pseudolabrys taiwanensis]AXK79287.1 MOSC domain-containing protein [Pseudolabrys taiwanensis]
MTGNPVGRVVAVCAAKGHNFSKPPCLSIRLLKGLGVEGDAHMGEKVKHLFLARKNPDAPNLRQVHLMHTELFEEVRAKGFDVKPGDLGENVTTEGIDLLDLSTGTKLHLGDEAVIEVTGLRNPCYQIDNFQKGLLHATLDKSGPKLVRKTGIMSIVLVGGDVRPGDTIRVEPPEGPHRPLELV